MIFWPFSFPMRIEKISELTSLSTFLKLYGKRALINLLINIIIIIIKSFLLILL